MAHKYSQPRLLLLVTTIALFVLCVTSRTSQNVNGDPVNGVGAWDAEKQYLEELGEYAVLAHNLASQHQLTFEKVISFDNHPGFNHKLTIAATDCGVSHAYEAVVCSKPWIQYKKLISFKHA
ncbi:cysteine proteinase inhibitor A-like [Rutidosis leptorrhynchoides]|uniref:cysteine proteinase inhibitor A-like n=1 Tax=Rutidosis leptorrhynchoides TaxID=125765 RepID=UPI003A99B2DA